MNAESPTKVHLEDGTMISCLQVSSFAGNDTTSDRKAVDMSVRELAWQQWCATNKRHSREEVMP